VGIISELKRRSVFKVGAVYAAIAWLLVEVSATTFPMLRLPEWAPTLVLVLLLIGFPIALVLAWAFEMTPEGIRRDTASGGKHDTEASTKESEAAGKSVITGAPAERSIAVLPLVNMSDDESNEYFSDGLSEELLNLLAKIPELHVAARTSSFAFKGEKVDIPLVAGRLNVANVLEGSVRKSGDRVRITVQLIEAASGYHLWSETYDRTLDDIFAIQDGIARSVVDALKIRLLGEVPTVTETDPQTFALYLQGMYFATSGEGDQIDKAVQVFREALSRDPDYAPAWSGLAHVYWHQFNYGVAGSAERIEKAFEASERALALDGGLAEAYAVKALLCMSFDGQWSRAEAAISRGLEIAPGDAQVVIQAGHLARAQGRLDDAERHLKRAIALDPLNTTAHIWLSMLLMSQGRLDEAVEIIEQILALNPRRAVAHQLLGRIHILRGQAKAALEELDKEPDEFWRRYGMNLALVTADRQDEADAILQQLIDGVEGDAAYFQVAESMAFRGRHDEAFEWLEMAHEQRDTGITEMMTSPFLRPLHTDARWPALLDKLGLRQSTG
jgi:TolB-like protein/Flp pilus assembly protein TadD